MALTQYQNENFSKDWVCYYDNQVDPERMIRVYEEREIEFLVWTRERADGITAVWVQTPARTTRWQIQGWFPSANWVGTTGGKEEYAAWFKEMAGDRFLYRGRYHARLPKGMRAGRTMIDEICEAVAAFTMSEEADEEMGETPGVLVRTYAQYF